MKHPTLLEQKRFAFTIIDDTDDATLENTKPIYDLLYEKRVFVTKTVWVYPPRDAQSKGDSLQRPEYLDFIRDLKSKGFEIGLHGVGSGSFSREEVLHGVEEFRHKLGEYPRIHVNHSYNPDSIYGGYKRFSFPFRQIVRLLYRQYDGVFQGDEAEGPFYWGDKYKEIIRFSRNYETDCINTARFDRSMPYIDTKKSDCCNYWFSATFAPNQWIFNRIVNRDSIKRLEDESGTCIIFTHLGYFMRNGEIDPGFSERIALLASNPNGIYLPVSDILERIAEQRKAAGNDCYPTISRLAKMRMECAHLWVRYKYRKIIKIDDYAFKGLDREMFVGCHKSPKDVSPIEGGWLCGGDMMERYSVGKMRISAVTMDQAMELIDGRVQARQAAYICVTNVRTTMLAQKDDVFCRIQNESLLTIPDGMPLVWYAHLGGVQYVERVCGPDLMLNILARSAARGYSHYFYGSEQRTLDAMKARFDAEFGKLDIRAMVSPPFRRLSEREKQETANHINDLNPTFVWVGLGAPKQEYWMWDMIGRVRSAILVGVGAAFPIAAGEIRRGPVLVRRMGLEWLLRCFQQPRRVPRFAIPFFRFNGLLLKQAARCIYRRMLASDAGSVSP